MERDSLLRAVMDGLTRSGFGKLYEKADPVVVQWHDSGLFEAVPACFFDDISWSERGRRRDIVLARGWDSSDAQGLLEEHGYSLTAQQLEQLYGDAHT